MYDKLFRPIVQHEGFLLYVIFGSVALLMFIYAIWCARWVYRNDHGKTPAKGKKGKKKKAPAKKRKAPAKKKAPATKKPAARKKAPAKKKPAAKAPPKSTALVKRDDARADQTPAAKESGPDD